MLTRWYYVALRREGGLELRDKTAPTYVGWHIVVEQNDSINLGPVAVTVFDHVASLQVNGGKAQNSKRM